MRRVLTSVAATAAILIAGSTAAATATGCARVKIGATTTCLVAGRPCNPSYEKQYRHHGFKCRRNTAGRYRLWQVPIHSLPPAV
jgi:hypothetical protein